MEKYYKISESELRELLHDSLKLIALESGGVDNWSWYGESISNYIKQCGNPNDDSLYDIVDRDYMSDYVEVI